MPVETHRDRVLSTPEILVWGYSTYYYELRLTDDVSMLNFYVMSSYFVLCTSM